MTRRVLNRFVDTHNLSTRIRYARSPRALSLRAHSRPTHRAPRRAGLQPPRATRNSARAHFFRPIFYAVVPSSPPPFHSFFCPVFFISDFSAFSRFLEFCPFFLFLFSLFFLMFQWGLVFFFFIRFPVVRCWIIKQTEKNYCKLLVTDFCFTETKILSTSFI